MVWLIILLDWDYKLTRREKTDCQNWRVFFRKVSVPDVKGSNQIWSGDKQKIHNTKHRLSTWWLPELSTQNTILNTCYCVSLSAPRSSEPAHCPFRWRWFSQVPTRERPWSCPPEMPPLVSLQSRVRARSSFTGANLPAFRAAEQSSTYNGNSSRQGSGKDPSQTSQLEEDANYLLTNYCHFLTQVLHRILRNCLLASMKHLIFDSWQLTHLLPSPIKLIVTEGLWLLFYFS